jgi:spore maturation protein CgeB
MITAPSAMAAYQLEEYDGVLAYGRVPQDMYLASGRVQRAWTWHEAADTRVFRPVPPTSIHGEVVWIGNGGDDERAAELREFLFEPVRDLALRARVYGVRYPAEVRAALREAGIAYGGWLPNFCVPDVFARFLCTVHIPRRPYVRALPGIPTIRPFEALACGISLISSPWPDSERLSRPGTDFLVARNAREMRRHLKDVLENQALATSLTAHGLATIRRRHTCAHRADELLDLIATLDGGAENRACLRSGRVTAAGVYPIVSPACPTA